MYKALIVLCCLLVFGNAGAQSKKETLEWITNKFKSIKINQDIRVCCSKNEVIYCDRTRKVEAKFEAKDSTVVHCSLIINCNFSPNEVPQGNDTKTFDWQIFFIPGPYLK